MELRGQEKDSMPSSSLMSYNNPSSLNHVDSSAKVVSAPAVSTLPERRRNAPDQTLDQTNLAGHQHHHHHQQQPHLLQLDQHDKDLNPDPDPAQVANITTTTNANASNSKIQTPTRLPPRSAANTATSSSTSTWVRYRDCLKNHAASMGGHVVDGCGEFMPSGEEGTPEALRCAACDCHRNFHRKESDGTGTDPQTSSYYYARHNSTTSAAAAAPHSSVFRPHHQHHQTSILTMPPQQHQHHHKNNPTAPIMMMTFGGGSGGEYSSSEDLNMFHEYEAAGARGHGQRTFSVSKKRFRTKFTQHQKERMHEFADKLGWKIQKQEEQQVQHFCDEVGVKRQVFKVWMHNNKQATKKKQM